jgi:prepilin-type N-terminal cleavage/methylation domain-containing protein
MGLLANLKTHFYKSIHRHDDRKMSSRQKHSGFSLTEILIAVGILSIGMVFIAGVFPAGLYYATVATERTIAAITADEAFAKIRIYRIDSNTPPLSTTALTDFNDVSLAGVIDPNEFLYPSVRTYTDKPDDPNKQYFWSALCRRVEPDPNRLVQVTVFVSRSISPNLEYCRPDPNGSGEVAWPTPHLADWPTPVKVAVTPSVVSGHERELTIQISNEKMLINDNYTIVDDANGQIYRVLERYRDDSATAEEEDAIILLDRNWEGTGPGGVWVVPPPVIVNPSVTYTYGRYPCIAVYQKVIKF